MAVVPRSQYGQLTEVWLDHGYGANQQQRLIDLLTKLQPNAVAFNGYGVSKNPSRWVGTEDGVPAYPIWSTGTSGQGDPTSSVWNAAVTDTTLQNGDHWFYLEGESIRTLPELVDVYHASVGANSVLELDFAIDPTGNVHPSHAAAYSALGDWIRSCYGTPVASTSGDGGNFTLPLTAGGSTIDRFIIQEDQTYGQRVRAFVVETQTETGGAWTQVAEGSSIGHKRIAIASAPVKAVAARLRITGAAASPVIMAFAAYGPCTVPSTTD
jgi:alpha-L-fucosidase